MIERKFIAQKIKEKQIHDYIANRTSGYNRIVIKKTPLGEKVTIHTVRPGLVVGVRGENIRDLTDSLKKLFGMENPQIEVEEIRDPRLDANAVADKIAYTLERFGSKRFKFMGYDTLNSIMKAGAMGAELVIGGRGVPSSRAKSWRFSAGYLRKCGDVAMTQIDKAIAVANLKSGTIGIKVSIMLPDTKLPDMIKIKLKTLEVVEKKDVIVEKEGVKDHKEEETIEKTEIETKKVKIKKEGRKERKPNKKNGNNKKE